MSRSIDGKLESRRAAGVSSGLKADRLKTQEELILKFEFENRKRPIC